MTNLAVDFKGPFSWPKYEIENGLPSLPKHPGLYLQAADYKEGYVVYLAGLTRRPLIVRFKEHGNKYMKGEYSVLDMAAMRQGKRLEVWHGWGWTAEKRALFEHGQQFVTDAVHKQLRDFRIFVADVDTKGRILERLEAAIMMHLYNQPPPFCNIPDRGMHLSSRWKSESPITASVSASKKLYGLPEKFEL